MIHFILVILYFLATELGVSPLFLRVLGFRFISVKDITYGDLPSISEEDYLTKDEQPYSGPEFSF